MNLVRVFLAVAAIASLAAPANAAIIDTLMERCFARVYDEAHLDKHPGQEVTRMTAFFVGFEDDVVAQLSFVTRADGHLFLTSGECTEEGGALACHVCAGDSCEWTDETFAIKVADKDRITILNANTGITAADYGDDGTETGKSYTLKPGGESGEFLLTDTMPEECGQ